MLVLTFDDGPSEDLTLDIMNLLEKSDARASFFLTGNKVCGKEDIVRQIKQRGHEICSHGFDHLNYLKVTPWRAISDIKKGLKAIDNALGINQVRYSFRPPYGKLNIISLLYLLMKRIHIVYWTDDSGDTWKPKPNSDRSSVIVNNSNGCVLLMHDFSRSDIKAKSWILDSVSLTLDAAKEKEMRFVTISELI